MCVENTQIKETVAWWINTSYEDAKISIATSKATIEREYIAIGFYLRHIRDNAMYQEDGYQTVEDMAKEQFGMGVSAVSRAINVNKEFSREGYSPLLADDYKGYSKSLLIEMLTMEPEERQLVTPDMTVKEVREIKADLREPAPEPQAEEPAEHEMEFYYVENLEPEITPAPDPIRMEFEIGEVLPDAEPEIDHFTLEQKGTDGAYGWTRSEMVRGFFMALFESGEDLHTVNSIDYRYINNHWDGKAYRMDERFVFCDEEKPCFSVSIDRLESELEWNRGYWQTRQAQTAAETQQKEPERVVCENNLNGYCQVLSDEEVKQPCVEGPCPEEVATSQESERWEELPCDTCGYDEKGCCNAPESPEEFCTMGNMWVPKDAPETGSEEVEPDLPVLPILKNNDQRKEFIDTYEKWPLWIETEETEERYYRYDLPDGTSMVVKVYYTKLFNYEAYGVSYEDRFHDGWGKEEYYLLREGRHFKECETNKSAMIDHLKELQRKNKEAQSE